MRERRPYRLRWIACVVVLMAASAVILWLPRLHSAPPLPAAPAKPALLAPPVIAIGGDTAGELGRRFMADEDGTASNDVVFLVAAAVRGRCLPASRHELATMAARARLPVLAGITAVLADRPVLRGGLLDAISTIAGKAPCDGDFAFALGAFRRNVSVAHYAAAFPDSYFTPELTTVPAEFQGKDLATRAADDCARVAYAVLPLDAPRAWQCTALRAQARIRMLALCHQDNAADVTALTIREAAERLPATCQ